MTFESYLKIFLSIEFSAFIDVGRDYSVEQSPRQNTKFEVGTYRSKREEGLQPCDLTRFVSGVLWNFTTEGT